VPVLREHMPSDHWLYAAYSQRRHNSAAMRTMLDFLEQSMARHGNPPAMPPLPPALQVLASPPSSSVATAATCALSRVPGAARATASAGRTDRPPRR
jgi:hypothetical protein